MPDGATFTVAAGEPAEPGAPLLVVPLPVDARLFAGLALSLCDWWENSTGRALTVAELGRDEDTEFGRALVVRQPVEGDNRG